MAKRSWIEKNKQRAEVVERYSKRRSDLKKMLYNKSIDSGERMQYQMEISKLPRDSSAVRVRNRCLLTGRSRGSVSKFMLSRIKFRELASSGKLPGVLKYSY